MDIKDKCQGGEKKETRKLQEKKRTPKWFSFIISALEAPQEIGNFIIIKGRKTIVFEKK